MEAVREYIFRLVCCGVCCTLLLSITGAEGPGGKLRKMLCGIFLAFTAISPLRDLDLESIVYLDPSVYQQAEQIAREGSTQAKEAMASIIKDRCGAYITTKAADLSLALRAEVELDGESGIPVEVTLHGRPTPQQRQAISDYITQTLGIERGHIRWNP